MTTRPQHPERRPARALPAALALAALLPLAACSPASTDAGAAPAASARDGVQAAADGAPSPLPLQDFIVAFHKANMAAGHGAEAKYQFPAIWLYAPGGNLHAQVTDEAGLARLRQEFGQLDPAQAAGGLSRDEVVALMAEAGAHVAAPARVDRWTALVLLDATECEGATCGPYAETVDQLLQAHPDALDAIRVALVR